MTKTVTLGAVAALLAVAGIVAWFALQESASPQRDSSAAPEAAVPADTTQATQTPRPRHAPAMSGDDSAAAVARGDLPAPVDLEKCDRDLDLFGTVVDTGGAGIAGAEIATVTYPWRVGEVLNVRDRDVELAGPSTRSARDGTFALRLSRGAAVALRVAADGFANVELPNVLAGEKVRVTMRPGVRLIVALADPDGKPVAGASVRLFNNTDRDGAASIRTRGVSGADGVCTFQSLPPGAWAWIAPEHAKGYAGWTKVELPASGEMRQEIKIPAGRTITGTVVDATTRSAVAGATVGMNWVLDMAVTSKADGSYELPGWTGNGVDDVHVLAEGYARGSKKVGSAERLDFELQRGYSATGRVVGGDASAVPGAHVSFIASEMSGRDQSISMGYATSDADGRFRVTGLQIGMRHVLVVSAPGHARMRRDTPVAATADEIALGDIALAPPRRVEGVVIGGGGTPEPRVAVTLDAPSSQRYESNSYGRSVSGFTDDLGRFRFADVAPGSYSVTARAQGAPETVVDVTVAPDADVLDVKVVRAKTREVVVTVVDSAGDSVAQAVLNLSERNGKSVQGRTDAQGVGKVSVAAEGKIQLYVWVVSEGPKKFLQFQPRDLRDDETDVRVVLEIGAEVKGRLVDPDGAPVAGAGLRFQTAGDAAPYAQSDADGRFHAIVPATGTSTLSFDGSVRRGNLMEDSGLTARVEGVAPGADLVVRCERVAKDRKLNVLVVSPQETPFEGATVFVSTSSGFRASAKTDAKGCATFENLAARELSVSVWFRGGEFLPPAAVKAVPQGQDLRLVCRAASKITGSVAGEDGAAQPGGMVQAFRDGAAVGYAEVDREGRFTLLLPSGETAPVRLQLNRSGANKPPEAVLDGVAPGTQDVRLVVKK
jgi:protocatechuate 3,4-dioxygenase beta subunit